MDRTVMGLFDEGDAEAVVVELKACGVPLSRLNVIDQDEGDEGAETKGRGAGEGESLLEKGKALWARLKAALGADVPEHHQHLYHEGIKRGGTLVAVDVPEIQVERIRVIMANHHAVDLEERSAEWRKTGWTGGQVTAARSQEAAGVGGPRTSPRTSPRTLGASDVDIGAARPESAANEEEAEIGGGVGSEPDYKPGS
jgi:hypothetical protein